MEDLRKLEDLDLVDKSGNKKRILILVHGQKRTGKDTFVEEFCNIPFDMNFDFTYDRLAFADSIKDQLAVFVKNLGIVECHPDYFNIENFKEQPFKDKYEDNNKVYFKDGSLITPRKLLQWYGEMMKESFGLDFWVNTVIDKMKKYDELLSKKDFQNYIISDYRFKFEETFMRDKVSSEYNIYTVKVNRDTGLEDSHISENHLASKDNDYFDFIVENNGTIEDLKIQANNILNEIKRLNK